MSEFFCRHKVLKPKLEGKCFKTTYHFFKRADCMRESSVLLLGFISEISFFGHLLCENETRLATLTTSSQVLKQHLGYSIIVLVTNCSQKPNYRNFSDVPDQRSTFLKIFFQKVQWLFDLYFPQIFEKTQITKKSLSFTSFCFSLNVSGWKVPQSKST